MPSAPSPVATPGPLMYTADDLQRVTKLHMEAFTQAQARCLERPREQPLKSRLPELYYGELHTECYHFCQQCEDHFDSAGATVPIAYLLQAYSSMVGPNFVGTQATSRGSSSFVVDQV